MIDRPRKSAELSDVSRPGIKHCYSNYGP